MTRITTGKGVFKYLARCEKIVKDADQGIYPTQRRLNIAIADTEQLYKDGMIDKVVYDLMSKYLKEVFMKLPRKDNNL